MTYASPQSVTLSCAVPGATILYETDGSLPDPYSHQYSAPIPVQSTTTIRAFAVPWGMQQGYGVSELSTGTYAISP